MTEYRLDGPEKEPPEPSPEPDPQLTTTPCEDMEAAEDAEQGLVARRRKTRAAKIRVRRKK